MTEKEYKIAGVPVTKEEYEKTMGDVNAAMEQATTDSEDVIGAFSAGDTDPELVKKFKKDAAVTNTLGLAAVPTTLGAAYGIGALANIGGGALSLLNPSTYLAKLPAHLLGKGIKSSIPTTIAKAISPSIDIGFEIKWTSDDFKNAFNQFNKGNIWKGMGNTALGIPGLFPIVSETKNVINMGKAYNFLSYWKKSINAPLSTDLSKFNLKELPDYTDKFLNAATLPINLMDSSNSWGAYNPPLEKIELSTTTPIKMSPHVLVHEKWGHGLDGGKFSWMTTENTFLTKPFSKIYLHPTATQYDPTSIKFKYLHQTPDEARAINLTHSDWRTINDAYKGAKNASSSDIAEKIAINWELKSILYEDFLNKHNGTFDFNEYLKSISDLTQKQMLDLFKKSHNDYSADYGTSLIFKPALLSKMKEALLIPGIAAPMVINQTDPKIEWQKQGGILSAKSGIHIKPENKGKLTKLKRRTGKTESELWKEGDSSVRKMITFARNSRKWHK